VDPKKSGSKASLKNKEKRKRLKEKERVVW